MVYVERLNLDEIELTKYLFFTGKGGVGKTSLSSSIAVNLADQGKRIALVSTDPASNLQDIFNMSLTNELTQVPALPNLYVANFEPVKAAEAYKQSVIEPYIGVLPEFAIKNMEEQLSGSCTVEVAAFNEFTSFLTNETLADEYDHIIFDTAPTGHTLRMLELPEAWSSYLESATHEASCLGQLSGLGEQQSTYFAAVERLKNEKETTMIFVARGDKYSLLEAKRAMHELNALQINHHLLIINGLINHAESELAKEKRNASDRALQQFESLMKKVPTFYVELKPCNVMGLGAMRHLFSEYEHIESSEELKLTDDYMHLELLVDELVQEEKRYIFTMGKGGVGKTTVASLIAEKLVARNKKVLLATTDPANQWHDKHELNHLTIKYIDPKQALADYEAEVLHNANQLTQEQIDYIKEDLRSPCTEEIAFFRAFSNFIADTAHDVVVIDTAPTGHTLLLLDASQSYHKEIERSTNEVPQSVSMLLPKILDNALTEMIIVTLAEPTPVKEAMRLKEDLERASIKQNRWVVNNTIANYDVHDALFSHKIMNERKVINDLLQDKLSVTLLPYDPKLI
ncbi:arsenical pump-driving ATPase [Macrococcoides canis]|uniref:arsenical pump-driving ATPase n=1 Tax=Macrococcoides canis TaxID=1855823 RepID=UPI001F2074A6|nr:arsenical pump-driving ATPase [Macrococcus canis]